MKIMLRIMLSTLFASFLLTACQKEVSFEAEAGGGIVGGGTSEGALGGSPGACANTTVMGAYGVGLVLNDSNKVEIEVNFTKVGSYYISTDTVNGIFFSRTGFISAVGTSRITLLGVGTPASVGIYPFKVSFKGTECSFEINVYAVAFSINSDYFPLSVGSNWTYTSSDPNASAADTVLSTSTGTTATIETNAYSVFTREQSVVTDSAFFRKASSDYIEYGDLDVAGITTGITPTSYIFLKDNVAVGTEWESPEAGAFIDTVGVKIKLQLSIAEKNVNVQIGNLIYKNVIKVRATEFVLMPGTPYAPVVTYESWYAKGIGLINITAPAPVYGYTVDHYQVF
jgi:hypothetical protein